MAGALHACLNGILETYDTMAELGVRERDFRNSSSPTAEGLRFPRFLGSKCLWPWFKASISGSSGHS